MKEGDKSMKRINVIYLLSLLLFAASCMDEELVKSNQYDIVEGVPVTVSLGFGVKESKLVETRAAASDNAEQRVYSLFVIAFKSDGTISGSQMYDDIDQTGSGQIRGFSMTSGNNQQLFAVANAGQNGDGLDEELAAFTPESNKTLTDFLALTSTPTNASTERSVFLMSGQLMNTEGGTSLSVDENGSFLNAYTESNIVTIYLNRVDARVTFRVYIDQSEHTNMTFTPNNYRVRNFSRGTYVIPNTNESDYTAGGYDSTTALVFDDRDASDDGYYSFAFYVMENRLTPQKAIATDDAATYEAEHLYALREKREKDTDAQVPDNKPGQDYVLGDFMFANQNSTYVEISGILQYTEGDQTVTADVTYTIHLGDTGNSTEDGKEWYNNVELVNNYDTERNTHYIYKVTLAGVESMRTEVTTDKETRPGVEGDVTVRPSREYLFDSHYGRAKFELSRGAIQGGLTWSISTPFQSGSRPFNRENYFDASGNIAKSADDVANSEALQTGLELNDYRWVQFVINAEAEKATGGVVPSTEFAKFPGYQAYSGGSGNNTKAPAFGGNGFHYTGNTAYYGNDVVLYDVNQLLNYLYLEAHNEGSQLFYKDGVVSAENDATVTITAFIDEYVYIYNPLQYYYRSPEAVTAGDEGLQLWKRVVNGENRSLSIISVTNGTQYSPDGNTSWTESSISFTQRPIYTFYNPDNVDTAWGVESEMETGKLKTTPVPSLLYTNSSQSNGRTNTLSIIHSRINGQQLRWTDVLHVESENWGELKDDVYDYYNTIWYACLGRNRDLNGNDIVDNNEIRWYLASIDQLTDLWIGENVLPDVAKLYNVAENVTGTTVKIDHVASSSLESGDNVWVIWAEEGASRGGRGGSVGQNGDLYSYRCIRNLGLSLTEDQENVEPEPYFTLSTGTYRVWNGWQSNSYDEYRVDVSKLNPNVLRTGASFLIQSNHNERSNDNRPAQKFAVMTDNIYPLRSYISDWDDMRDESTGNPCPRGYRIPNQRELLLLTMFFGPESEYGYNNIFPYTEDVRNDDWNTQYIGVEYAAKTSFSYNSTDYETYSWTGDDGNKTGSFSKYRLGFTFDVDANSSTFRLTDASGSYALKVRCVRDVVN